MARRRTFKHLWQGRCKLRLRFPLTNWLLCYWCWQEPYHHSKFNYSDKTCFWPLCWRLDLGVCGSPDSPCCVLKENLGFILHFGQATCEVPHDLIKIGAVFRIIGRWRSLSRLAVSPVNWKNIDHVRSTRTCEPHYFCTSEHPFTSLFGPFFWGIGVGIRQISNL